MNFFMIEDWFQILFYSYDRIMFFYENVFVYLVFDSNRYFLNIMRFIMDVSFKQENDQYV